MIWVVQCLCGGPQRHLITQLAFDDKEEMTVKEATEALATTIRRLLASHQIEPFCGLCESPAAHWVCEASETEYETMEEARGPLEDSAATQLVTAFLVQLEKKRAAASKN
jgi:hypothetical protein